MITTIAFDLIGVILEEKDVVLSPFERALEKGFGVYGNDEGFLTHFEQETGLTPKEIEMTARNLISRLYQFREPDLFQKLPPLKFAVATSHQSYIIDWLKMQSEAIPFSNYFSTGSSGFLKTEPMFFIKLAELLEEHPADILFIDDHLENCRTAQSVGMRAVHYKPIDTLSHTALACLKAESSSV